MSASEEERWDWNWERRCCADGGVVSWEGGGVLAGHCEPFDIVDVVVILQITTVGLLYSSLRDVGERCLRSARRARALYVW